MPSIWEALGRLHEPEESGLPKNSNILGLGGSLNQGSSIIQYALGSPMKGWG